MAFAIISFLFKGLGKIVNVFQMKLVILFAIYHNLRSSITCSWLASTQFWTSFSTSLLASTSFRNAL